MEMSVQFKCICGAYVNKFMFKYLRPENEK